jgi:hypothetical protein
MGQGSDLSHYVEAISSQGKLQGKIWIVEIANSMCHNEYFDLE